MSDQPAYQGELTDARSYDYDAFLSYSRADAPAAEGIQKGLHKVGRKMGRLHALRVFRDKTDLAASASLWEKIRAALDSSRFLVVVLSPNSAGSEWVNKEVDYWLTHRGPENLILVLADGTIIWDGSHGRFDPSGSTAALPTLATENALADEPVYIDISEDNPWNIDNPIFRDKITDIAAPIHGKPKYELASEDLKEQQRFRRFRRLAIAGLAILTVLAVVAATLAFTQRREALQQRNAAVARSLTADGEAILRRMRAGGDDRALQEFLTAYRLTPAIAQGGLLSGLQSTATTQKIIRTADIVTAVAITPDGSRIFVGNGDTPAISIFDGRTGQPIGELQGHRAGVSSLAISADGARLVSGSHDDTVRVWDLASGAAIGEPLTGFDGSVRAVAISPDGIRVAAAGFANNNSARIWDIDDAHPVEKILLGHEEGVASVAFSPDGQRLATGDNGGTILVWDAETGERAPTAPMHTRLTLVNTVAFSPGGKRIVSGHSDDAIRQWDAATGEPIGEPLTGHTEPVSTLTYSPDAAMIISGSWDKTLRRWSSVTGEPIGEPLIGHDDWVSQLVLSSDGRRIISGSQDHTVRIWDGQAEQLGQTTRLGLFDTAALSADGRLFAGARAGSPATVSVGDNIEEREVASWSLSGENTVMALAVSPDNQKLAIGMMDPVGSGEPTIEIWDIDAGARLVEIQQPHRNGISDLAFSPDSSRLVSGGFDPDVRIWDTQTGEQIGPDLTGAESDISAVTFSPDGTLVAAGSKDEQLRVWSAKDGKSVGPPMGGHALTVKSVAFSPDGRLIASGDAGDVRLWDTGTHEQIGAPMTGHDGLITSLAFSADGQLLASGSLDSSVRIWDVRTTQQIGSPLTVEKNQGNDAIAFSPDGRRLASASDAGKLTVWPGPAPWADLLCDKLTANMSRGQWNLWVSPDIDYLPACPDLPIPE